MAVPRAIRGMATLGSITLTWAQVLVIALAAVGFYVLELLLFLRSTRDGAARAEQARAREEAIVAEQRDLGERLRALEGEIDRLRRQPQTSGQYREAVSLAQQGSDARAVAESCGISQSEAELIVALHRSSPD